MKYIFFNEIKKIYKTNIQNNILCFTEATLFHIANFNMERQNPQTQANKVL